MLLAVGDCVHQTGVREILIICQPEPVPDVILQSGIPMIQDKDGNGQFFVELCSDCHFEIHKRTATVQPPHRKPGFAAVAQIFGQADLIDVELFRGEELLRDICREAKARGVKVIASSHDFEKTPAKEEILARLIRMQDCGADLLKLAVMPQDAGDVLTLLSATWEMQEQYAKQPVVTMSMGPKGAVSCLAGEVFGSAMTFGSTGVASAPGQVSVPELKMALEVLRQG